MSKSFWMKEQKANFSNQKEDTFDPGNHFIGIRLQQGVPLLDRDWNELEDIRRYQETVFRKWYIGSGIPAEIPESFQICPTDSPNDFVIKTGRCIVDGFEVVNEKDINYTEQEDVPDLSTPQSLRNDIVYLDVWIKELTADMDDPKDPLSNPQDVGQETCIRHKLCWCVRVKEDSSNYEDEKEDYHHYYTLAKFTRKAGQSIIKEEDIKDLRLIGLTLEKLVDNSMADDKHKHSRLFGKEESPDPALSVDNDGKVGIGIPTPAAGLDLQTSVHPIARFSSTGSGNTWVRIQNATSGMHLGIGQVTKHPYVWSHSNAFFIGNDANPTFYLEGMANGKLGICTIIPEYVLDVRRIGDFIARFGNDNGSDLTIDVAGGQGLANIVAGAKVSGNAYVFTGARGASRIRLHDGILQLLTSTVDAGEKDNLVNWNVGLFINKDGRTGVGTNNPGAQLDVNGFTKSLGISVNNASDTGVGRGLWLWSPSDSNHVIYSASPDGKSPANGSATRGEFNNGHRMRLRTATGQGFLFENHLEKALVDIDSDNGRLWTKGAIYCGNSDIYFTETDHNHSAIGNTAGYAAIENAANYGALMILGRTTPNGRRVRLWDYLQVNGSMDVTNAIKTNVLYLGEKWRLSGIGDKFADDHWLRLCNKDNTDYYGGFAADNLWTHRGVVLSSDLQLKKEIRTIKKTLGKLRSLRGVYFKWKNTEKRSKFNVGLIAQEVEPIFPELVGIGPDGMKSINYTGLSVFLLEGIKEQQTQISELSVRSHKQQEIINGLLSSKSGNDYAENWESMDGKRIQPGTAVVLERDKIRPARKNEIPFGIISINPSIRGGVYLEWPDKYLKDDFGNFIMEEYKEEIMIPKKKKVVRERQKVRTKKISQKTSKTDIIYKKGKYCRKATTKTETQTVEEPVFKEVNLYDVSGKNIIGKHKIPVMEKYKEEIDVLDENGQPVLVGSGKFVTKKRPKINSKYDESKKYIPREERPEWNCVGLLGQIPLRKGQPVAPTWVKIKNISKEVELWLVK